MLGGLVHGAWGPQYSVCCAQRVRCTLRCLLGSGGGLLCPGGFAVGVLHAHLSWAGRRASPSPSGRPSRRRVVFEELRPSFTIQPRGSEAPVALPLVPPTVKGEGWFPEAPPGRGSSPPIRVHCSTAWGGRGRCPQTAGPGLGRTPHRYHTQLCGPIPGPLGLFKRTQGAGRQDRPNRKDDGREVALCPRGAIQLLPPGALPQALRVQRLPGGTRKWFHYISEAFVPLVRHLVSEEKNDLERTRAWR